MAKGSPLSIALILIPIIIIGVYLLGTSTPTLAQIRTSRFGTEVAEINLHVSGFAESGNLGDLYIVDFLVQVEVLDVRTVDPDFTWDELVEVQATVLMTLTPNQWAPVTSIGPIPVPASSGPISSIIRVHAVPTGSWTISARAINGWSFDSPDGPNTISRLVTI